MGNKYNNNRSLRLLRLSGNDSITSKSSASLVHLLRRYPMLSSITLGSKCRGIWTPHEKLIRHLINVNESGRVLLAYADDNNVRDADDGENDARDVGDDYDGISEDTSNEEEEDDQSRRRDLLGTKRRRSGGAM